MNGRGAWWDNMLRGVNYEPVRLKGYAGVSAARTDVADYLD
jgi:hypothetical protein